MREQHIEHTVRRSGPELKYLHDHRGSEAARVLPKKLGRRVSERRASTARSEPWKKKIASILQFAKIFQHE